jgi:hypothetical protein
MAKYWPDKDPNSIEPYFVIWCDKTGTNVSGDDGELQGATISTVTWTVPTGITAASNNTSAVTIDGIVYGVNTVTTVWLTGGSAGTSYTLNCRITTSDLRTLDQSCIITVEDQ